MLIANYSTNFCSISSTINVRASSMESTLHVHGWNFFPSSIQFLSPKFTASFRFQPVLIPQ